MHYKKLQLLFFPRCLQSAGIDKIDFLNISGEKFRHTIISYLPFPAVPGH